MSESETKSTGRKLFELDKAIVRQDGIATTYPDEKLLELGKGLFPPKISTPADLGFIIRQSREKKSLSQQQLADLAGVGRRFLSELENGKQSLEFGKVIQVSNSLGIDLFAKHR